MTDDKKIKELEEKVAQLEAQLEDAIGAIDRVNARCDHIEDGAAGESEVYQKIQAINEECSRQFYKIAVEHEEAHYIWWSP